MALFVEEGKHLDAVAGSLSLRSIAWKIGEVVGPFIVGVVWNATSVTVAFWLAAGILVVSTEVFASMYHTEATPDTAPTVGD